MALFQVIYRKRVHHLSQQPKNNHDTEKNSSLAAILGLALTASSASSAILVYEGFDYGPAADETRAGNALLDGQPDGVSDGVNAIGLSGVWADSTAVTATSDLYMANGSLAFGDLATSGNHFRSDTNNNNDIMSRTISATLAGTNSELWFSFTANKLQNDFSAAEGGIVIGNTTVGNARIFENDGSSGLQGFGVAPTTTGDNWTAYGWNGTTQVAGANAFSVPTNGSETNLLVGQIEFDAGTGGLDIFTLSYYVLNGGSVIGGSLTEITSLEVDVTQSTLDTLNLTRQVNTAYDEIRIGESLNDVVLVPEPSAALLGALGALLLFRRRR